MNCKILNTAMMNVCDSPLIALVDNFFDIVVLCPPLVTFVPPQNRVCVVPPAEVTYLVNQDTDGVST